MLPGGIGFAMHGARKAGDHHGSTFSRLASLEARGAKRANRLQALYLPVIFFAYGLLLGKKVNELRDVRLSKLGVIVS